MISNFRINRLAKQLVAAGFNKNIDSEVLEYCKKKMQELADEYFEQEAILHINDGNSYDGYMSFTEGDVECAVPLCGWDLIENSNFSDEYDKLSDSMRESFVWDNRSLLEENGIDFDQTSEKEVAKEYDFTGADAPEAIQNAFERYEEGWMSDAEYYAVVEVQFHNDGNGDQAENYDVSVYAYLADEYMRNKQYFYEDSFNLGESAAAPYALVDASVEKAFKKISK